MFKVLNEKIPSCKAIVNPKALIDSLNELDAMIGMNEVKKSIYGHVCYLINNKSNGFDDKMLNTIITGPPGVGKTSLAKILGKIWMAIGIFDRKRKYNSIFKKGTSDPRDSIEACGTYEVCGTNEACGACEINDVEETSIDQSDYFCKCLDDLKEDVWDISDKIDTIKLDKKTKNSLNSKIDKSINLISHMHNLVNMLSEEVGCKKDPVSDIVFCSREDFIGPYQGHTVEKTKKLLFSCLGKILIIDEAYTLFIDSGDSFGMEALTALNLFMSEHPNEIIVIFCGYKDKLEKSIFTAQPGLLRRTPYSYNIEKYTPEELSQIFNLQLKKDRYTCNVDLVKFFTVNYDNFPNYGGDVENLLHKAKINHSIKIFEKGSKFNSVLEIQDLESGIMKINGNGKEEWRNIYI